MSPSRCFERQQFPSRRIFFPQALLMRMFNAVKVLQLFVISLLSQLLLTLGPASIHPIWALMPFRAPCTINSCQQVQNDVQVLPDTWQQGQSLSSQSQPSSFSIKNL